jgi:hypothetical protein
LNSIDPFTSEFDANCRCKRWSRCNACLLSSFVQDPSSQRKSQPLVCLNVFSEKTPERRKEGGKGIIWKRNSQSELAYRSVAKRKLSPESSFGRA